MKKSIVAGSIVLASLLAPAFAFADVSITLQGPNPVTVQAGQPFVEPGFTALSDVDGDITSQVVTTPVHTNIAGNTSENYFVTDSTLATASASRGVDVQGGGGGLIFCSGPMAPGYNVGLAGGGCGGSTTYVPYNAPLAVSGVGDRCQFFMGCVVPRY